jgi:hypothetical protein
MGQESDSDPSPGVPPPISYYEGDSPGNLPLATDDTFQEEATEPPPDGGYGWAVVGACFTINCFSWGVTAVSL